MENTIFMRPHFGIANGLCNQLSFVINTILYASKHNKKYVVLDNFLKDNKSLISCPYGEIINLPVTNKYLKKYNVELKEKNSVNIDSNTLENLFQKYSVLTYSDLDYNWISYGDFFEIYNNIQFQNHFYNLSNNLIIEIHDKLGNDVKINIIHLRIEDDAVNHWSKRNNMSALLFKVLLVDKYLYLIKKYINKESFTIVNTYNKDNIIIKFLYENGYKFFTKKSNLSDGRECNALRDLLLARKMNNFFIGATRSTFSDFILNSASFKKSIMIDLDNVKSPAVITDR
jgi:hypothetical protein